jgi:hypothetical protein
MEVNKMDHVKLINRAFKITWDYKTLWIFGIILALTMVGSNGPNNSGNQAQYTADKRDEIDWSEGIPETIELPDGDEISVPESLQEVETWITIGVSVAGVCCCLVIIWIVAGTVMRYVAETSLIRMVDHYEETNEKLSFKAGFRLGWNPTSFRLFLIDLLLFLGGLILFAPLIVLLIALAGVSAWLFTRHVFAIAIVSVVAAAGLFFLTILLGVIVGIFVELLKPLFQRACVLDGLNVGDSLSRSVDILKQHFAWDLATMWAIVIGLNIGWIIATTIVGLILAFAALVIAAIPALLVGGLTGLFWGWIGGLISGGIVGGLIFVLVLIAIGIFLQGLRVTFLSTLWTLTYRELRVPGYLEDEEPWDQPDSHELV